MIFIALIIAMLLIFGAWAIHPGLGITVAILSYWAIDGLRSRKDP